MTPYWHAETLAAIARKMDEQEIRALQIQIFETSGVPGLAESYRRHIAQSQNAPDLEEEIRTVLLEPPGPVSSPVLYAFRKARYRGAARYLGAAMEQPCTLQRGCVARRGRNLDLAQVIVAWLAMVVVTWLTILVTVLALIK